jgi:hypothetical protein
MLFRTFDMYAGTFANAALTAFARSRALASSRAAGP